MGANEDIPRAVDPPELPDASELTPVSELTVGNGGFHAEVSLAEDVVLADTKADELGFECAVFSKTNLSGTRWTKLRLVDARLVACDLANAQWLCGLLRRVEISRCRLTGMGLSRARIGHVRFIDCKCDQATFQESTFEACRFEACDLRGADFQEADLRGVVFAGCDLRDANLVGANLVGADFRGSKIEALGVRGEDLRGAVVDASQAISFATVLGMTVKGHGIDDSPA